MSKFLPWIVVFLSLCGNVYVYAQSKTQHEEKIKVLYSLTDKNEKKIEKEKDKQDKRYNELKDSIKLLDIKLTRVIALLEK